MPRSVPVSCMVGVGEPVTTDVVDLQAEACTIGYNEDLGAVVAEWRPSDDPDAYREGMERLLDRVEARDARKLLSDARATVPVSDSLMPWITDEWLPRLAETSVEYEAVVYPVDATATFFVDEVGRAHTGIDVEPLFAEDMETARAWLRMQ